MIRLPAVGLLCVSLFVYVIPVPAQTTIRLPVAAHAVGQTAGSYVDPSTGFLVYRLSDRTLCAVNARHFYSYSVQFSPLGRITFTCFASTTNPSLLTFPIYDSNFKLLFTDALAASGGPRPSADTQWSQQREVLLGRVGTKIYEYDPFNRTNRVFADFSAITSVIELDGTQRPVGAIGTLSVGPADRLLVKLQCRLTQTNCPADFAFVGIGTYDPATGRYAATPVPHAIGVAPKGFDEGQWSQNPAGRPVLIYNRAHTYTFSTDFSSVVTLDDNHGHPGFFMSKTGASFKVSVVNDTLSNGTVGQIGCSGVSPWTPEHALYDDLTGKRVLKWGCDMPNGTPLAAARFHFSRVPGSTSRDVFFGSGWWIARFTVQYNNATPIGVAGKLLASSRSDPSVCNGDYWAQPRVTADHTGTRALWDTNWRWVATPTVESDGSVITSCKKDVVVAVFTTGSDLTPPTISITSATPQTVRTLTIGFSASDNVSVVRIDSYLDGIFLGSTDPRTTQSATFDVSSFITGTHTLQLKAFDAAGNSNTANQYVTLP